MSKAIVIGASTGIGRALAKELAAEGYEVGVAARRLPLLKELAAEIEGKVHVQQLDLAEPETAMEEMKELVNRMGGCDVAIVAAAIVAENGNLTWPAVKDTIAINVLGFAAAMDTFFHYFREQKKGHLVAISSLAALRGNGVRPCYAASKAFVSNYTDGLRHHVAKQKLPVKLTIVQPGFVDTAQIEGEEGVFWVSAPEKAAKQIVNAIQSGKQHIYVSKRWRLIAWFTKLAPNALFDRVT